MSVMKHKGVLSSLAVMLLWGLLFSLVKLGYKAFGIESVGDILTFAGFRFLICGIVIIIFAVVRDPKCLKPIKSNWPRVLLSGLFAIVLHYAFTYCGLSSTDGSKTAILKQIGAILYICFSPLFFPDDKLTFGKIGGLLLGLCGVLAINANITGICFGIGDILIIAASFCTVIANIISKKLFLAVEPIISTGISQLIGGAALLTAGLCMGGDIGVMIPRTAHQFFVLGVIIIASVISYCLWYINVQHENLSKLFIIKFAEPLFAAVFGWILLSEDIFNINYLVAFLLISAGIVVANLTKKAKSC